MRVLVLHSQYLSGDASGENRVVADEARLLREAGHQVEVLAVSPAEFGSIRLGARTLLSAGTGREVFARVHGMRAEVVHCHNFFPALGPGVIRAASRAGAAVLVTLHNYRLLCLPATFLREGSICEACLGKNRPAWRGVWHGCYRGSRVQSTVLATSLAAHRALGTFDQVARFLAVSEFVRVKHVQGGLPPDRIAVKGNFTWSTSTRQGPGRYFLAAGRLSPEKGFDTLVSTWDSSLGRLLVVGDGSDMSTLRHSARPGVELVGPRTPDEMPEVITGARAVLVPSRSYEGQPRIVLEAYAAGVPVVTRAIGGLPELVDHDRTGLLVPSDDAAAWHDAVSQLTDDDRSLRMGRAALGEWKRTHSPAIALEALERHYAEARASIRSAHTIQR